MRARLAGQLASGRAGGRRRLGWQSARQGSDRSVSGGGCSVAELSDFEHERLLRLWLFADRAEDDDAVRAARELLACNQHGHWSGNPRARQVVAPSWRGREVAHFYREEPPRTNDNCSHKDIDAPPSENRHTYLPITKRLPCAADPTHAAPDPCPIPPLEPLPTHTTTHDTETHHATNHTKLMSSPKIASLFSTSL